MKILVYGKGMYYKQHKNMLPKNIEILAFIDSFKENTTKITSGLFENKIVISPEEIKNYIYDYIYVCTDVGYSWKIFETLVHELNISTKKIKFLYKDCQNVEWNYVPTDDGLGYINSIGKISYVEKTYTDFLSYEVLIRNEYLMPIKLKEYVVLDIGMNVGITSLWYANKENVIKVYAYEPFKDTYERALKNFALSSSLSEKIVPINCALLDRNEAKKIKLEIQESGQRNILIEEKEDSENIIFIKKISDELRKIRDDMTLPLVLNIDTEGSEFLIFRDLNRSGLFKDISIVIMEYHDNPKELFEILNENNFYFYYRDYGKTGLIFAHK